MGDTAFSGGSFYGSDGQSFSAGEAKVGLGRAGAAAGGAIQVRGGMLTVNHQIADVGNPGEQVGENENRIILMQGVAEQQQGTGQAQPPKRGRHDDPFKPLGRIPLHEKAGEEHRVAAPPDHLPYAPFDAEELAPVPDEMCEPVHMAGELTAPGGNRKAENRSENVIRET